MTTKIKINKADTAYRVGDQAANSTVKLVGNKKNASVILSFLSDLRTAESDAAADTVYDSVIPGIKNKQGDIELTFEGGRKVIIGNKLYGFAQSVGGEVFSTKKLWNDYVDANPIPGPGPTPGQTFTLTTNADTATANVFNGNVQIVGNFALNTLNNGDRLTGSGTNPTLNLTYAESAAAVTPALISGITTANVDFSTINGAAGTAINWNNGTGLTTVAWNNPVSANSLNNLSGALTSLAVSNTANDQTFTFTDAALAGTANTLNLTLTSVTSGAAAITLNTTTATAATSNYETINITSAGTVTNTASIAQNSAGLTTLNVSGSAGFTTVNASANLTTFNASTATGAISYTAGGEGNASYTGGSGGDTFLLGGTYTANDTVNGGSGTDVLGIDTPNAAVNQTNVSNIERIRMTADPNAAITIVPAFYGGATRIQLGATVTDEVITVTAAAGTTSFDFRTFDNDGGDLTVNVAGTAITDVYEVLFQPAAADDIISDITINNGETLNIINGGSGAGTIQGTVIVNPNIGATGSVNVSGSAAVFIEDNVTASAINASGLTAGGLFMITAAQVSTVTQVAVNITGSGQADWLAGSANADIISGGAGADTINGNGGADAIIGGAGFDQFNFGAATDGDAGQLNLANSYTTISDFVVGTTATTTDLLVLDTAIGAALEEFGGGGVADGDAAAVVTYVSNTAVDLSANTGNILKISGGVAGAALTAEAAFNLAIGAGAITINGAGSIVGMYYDTSNSQAVIGVIVSGDGDIVAGDEDFNVISRITMSASDYVNFGATNFGAFESTTI